jgi:CRISPR-associated exonuclease Cas4
MTGRTVSEGAIFYAQSKRRRVVVIDTALRTAVPAAAAAIRHAIDQGRLPLPTSDTRRCQACSLRDRCQPEATRRLLAGAAGDPFDPDG